MPDVMFMTVSTAYCTNNLGFSLDDLPLLFGISDIATIVFALIIGHFADKFGKLESFVAGSILTIVLVAIYSSLGFIPFCLFAIIHTLLFIGINARMIASSAIATIMPELPDRGCFYGIKKQVSDLKITAYQPFS